MAKFNGQCHTSIKRKQYSNRAREAAYFRQCNDIPMRCRINTSQY